MIVVPQEKIARYTQAGWWGERTLGELFIDTALRQPDLLAVADPPNRPAITGDAAQRWTWGELLTQVGRYCAFLDRQGIRKDDIIVVQMPNCVEMHAIYLACAVSGVVVSPVPMQYRAHELSHVLETTRARVAITTARVGKNSPAQQWAEQKSISPVIDRVWVYGLPVTNAAVPAASTLQAIEPALEQSVPWTATQLRAHLRAIGLTANDVLTICWTSGTEAMPKGVPRSHNEWLIVGLSVIDAGGAGARHAHHRRRAERDVGPQPLGQPQRARGRAGRRHRRAVQRLLPGGAAGRGAEDRSRSQLYGAAVQPQRHLRHVRTDGLAAACRRQADGQ